MRTETIVEIFFFDAGGGHRSAMNSLREVLAERRPEWRVVPVDLQKLLEPVDPIHRMTGRLSKPLHQVLDPFAPNLAFDPVQTQSLYNTALKVGATYGFGAIMPMLKLFISRHSAEIEALLAQRWIGAARPDLVVSVIPNFNGVMFHALRSVHPDVPYVTIMTDMVDCPPHFWMENQDQFLVCGTPAAFAQALDTGFYRPQRVFRVSGMILRREFCQAPERALPTREDLGLAPDRPTALIMFGGNGSRLAAQIVDRLRLCRFDVQSIVLCGRSRKLLARLRGEPDCYAVGFVSNVGDYMRLADFFIGKPGPGSISEAVQMGCPVIVECNARTMPQERPNVEWIRQNGVGLVVRNFRRNLVKAAERLIEHLEEYKTSIQRNVPPNHAVVEVTEILGRIVAEQDSVPVAAHLGRHLGNMPLPAYRRS